MPDNSNQRPKDWALYEEAKKWNNSISPNYYDLVNCNWDFYSGDQWRNVNAKNMPKPVMNVIKRAVNFQVANITTAKTKVHFEPLEHADTPPGVFPPEVIANAQVENLFDKFKMDFKLKAAATDGAVTGDCAAHFYFDMDKKPYGNAFSEIMGEICMELVDGVNCMFGNPNNSCVDEQPFIIISGRAMVEDLQAEQKKYKGAAEAEIDSDNNTQTQAGYYGKIEADSNDSKKATYIIIYRRKRVKRTKPNAAGVPIESEEMTIVASKLTEQAYIFKEVDTGLSTYPVSWFNWEKQKNNYHGRGLCTGMIPNQIFINRMFAMTMYHLQMTAFPKILYNADIIENWTNEVGTAIPVTGIAPEMSMRNVATNIEPANMSAQIAQVIDMAMEYTKDSLGVNDAALGNADPTNTSAIIAVQKATAVSFENPRSNMYEWVEGIGRILFDMMATYYGLRPVQISVDGVKQMVQYDFNEFKQVWLNVSCDVGESSYWSEIASIQTLTNLLQQGSIDIIQFLERTSNEYIPQREQLIQELKLRQQQAQMQAAAAAAGAPPGAPAPEMPPPGA